MDSMEGIISNFRGGKHSKRDNQMILKIPDVNTRSDAKKMLNKNVIWKSPAGKEIKGTLTNLHGNSGCLRIQFEKGMPGQAVGTKVLIQ